MRTVLAGFLVATLLLAEGCQQPSAPPVSLAEYDRLAKQGRPMYPKWTIFVYNLRRGLDPSVTQEARTQSLDLARRLAQEDPIAWDYLSSVANDLVSMIPPKAQAGTLVKPAPPSVAATPRAPAGLAGRPSSP